MSRIFNGSQGPGIGDNGQSLAIWDMTPELGGGPQRLVLHAVDAKERCACDPARYRMFFPDNPNPPQS